MQHQEKPFVNRTRAITLFQQLLNFEQPVDKPFLHFYGMSGIGKSFLLDHLQRSFVPSVATVQIRFEPGGADYNYLSFLSEIRRALSAKLDNRAPLQRFKEKSEHWQAQSQIRISKIENTISAGGGSTIDIGNSTQSVTLEKLQMELRHRLTEEFLDTVTEIEPRPLLIILDAVENLLPEIQSEQETPDYAGWLINFLPRFSECFPSARVLLAGRRRLTYDSLQTKCHALELPHLPQTDVVRYLQQIGITDAPLIDAVYRLTDGYALSVAMTGDLWGESGGTLHAADLDTAAFRESYRNKMVPELLMRRIMERAAPQLKSLMEWAGLFRYFTCQTLKDTFIPDMRAEDFQRFVRYSFITKNGTSYQYHAELRRLVTGNAVEQTPREFRQRMTELYHYFAERDERDPERDERFYYGIYGQVEGVFDAWENTCHEYCNTWQTDRLKRLVDMLNAIQQPFSAREQAAICFVKSRYFERVYLWDKALEYYRHSEQICIEVGDRAGLGPTYGNIGSIYSNKGEWDKALEYYRHSEQICIEVGDRAGLATTYNNIGLIYDDKGEWDKALEYYRHSEQIFIEVGDRAGLAPTYNNIGSIYDDKGEWDKALEYYRHSEQIKIEVGDRAGLAPTYNNIGLIYKNKGEWDKALEYYRHSEQISIEVGDCAGLGTTYNNIGSIYKNKGEWDKALEYYRHSEQIFSEVGDRAGLATTYNNLGFIYKNKGEWDKALEYYRKDEQISIEVGDRAGLVATYNNIGILYFEQKKFDLAQEYLSRTLKIGEAIGHPNLEQFKAALKLIRQSGRTTPCKILVGLKRFIEVIQEAVSTFLT